MFLLLTGSSIQELTPLDLLTTENGFSPTNVDGDSESMVKLMSEPTLVRKLKESSTLEAAEEASKILVRNVLLSTVPKTKPTLTLFGATAAVVDTWDGESSPLEESQCTDNHWETVYLSTSDQQWVEVRTCTKLSTSEEDNTEWESETSTSFNTEETGDWPRKDGSHSTQEPEPSDPGIEETLFSVTKLVKDSTLVKLLLLESGDLRSTKESEFMEETEITSEMTEESVWAFTEVTTTTVVMLSSGTATKDPTKDGKSSRLRTSQLLSSMSTHQSQIQESSNSEPS
jgi:hypothetical protein